MTSNKIGIYAIRDHNVKCFLPPFFAASDDDAIRMVSDAVEVGSVLARFPADFALYFFGDVDSRDGLVEPRQDFVAAISDIVRKDIIEASRPVPVPSTAIPEVPPVVTEEVVL